MNCARRCLLLAATLGAAWGAASRPAAALPAGNAVADVSVLRTAFVVRLANGRVLGGAELKGATLTLAMAADGAARKVRIDSVQTDPHDPDREITLYHLLSVDELGRTRELCQPDWRGERWGFPVRGRWDHDGRHVSNDGYTLTCADGAQGKCIRFGYKPWKSLPNGISLEPYHQACVKAVRADYCGDRGTTRDGMQIDIYDNLGIQQRDPASAALGLKFEAAWTPAGAVCVAHTRVPENMTLEQLAQSCPRLRGHLGPSVCTEQGVENGAKPALLFMRSR